MKTLSEQLFLFGDFELNGTKRLLLKQGEPVALNAKAFDLLSVLVENHGRVLSKDELLEKVWENQFVEENNLTVHISALRKIFGEKKNEHKFIVTIPGCGYLFVADVEEDGEKGRKGEKEKEDVDDDGQIATSEERRTKNKTQNLSPLIGRAREIAEIENLLRVDEVRLVTLTGAGGSGKTSLARTLASNLSEDFSDGVFFSELAAVNNAELVAAAMAKTLGVEESGSKSLTESLIDFLQERWILLILDNFEQILSAAPLLQKLINSTAFLKILVTSRHALHLRGEREIIIAPLALPPSENNLPVEKLNEYAAIKLFTRQANSVRQSFLLNDENAKTVAEICRRLDGLPLAIELAAARVKLLSPHSIFERLESSLNLLSGGAKDLPERQRTMRGAISWSYELLDENERELFRRLAVFAGGFTVEAAETVCVNDESEVQILDLLTSLVENSLLIVKEQAVGDLRLQMLEVVREFASECLENCGEKASFRQNHAHYFFNLAETAEPHLLGEMSVVWLETLENEIDNLRAALEFLYQTESEKFPPMSAALRHFWIYHNHFAEGLRWLNLGLEKTEIGETQLRFKFFYSLAIIYRLFGDYANAQKMYLLALDEGKAADDKKQSALSTTGIGTILQLKGESAEALKYFKAGLEFSRAIGDEHSVAYALVCYGIALGIEGKSAEARKNLEEALTLIRRFGGKEAISNTLNNVAAVAFDEGDLTAAREYFAEGLKLSVEVGNKVNIIDSLNGFAALAAEKEDFTTAAKISGAILGLSESFNYEQEPAERRFCEKYTTKIRAALDDRSYFTALESGRKFSIDETVEFAENFVLNSDELFTEIIIETHKFERIIIEEETDESDYEIKQINFLPQTNEE